ncbi:MAG: hypothetical protein FWD18_04710 [Micrococcales bacterium]|nr:hypothetical protein [Micrococcales bacterium]
MGEMHWFVDETKSSGFVVVVVVVAVPSAAVTSVRRALRSRLRPGQRCLHFTKESDPARRSVLAIVACSPVSVHVYHLGRKLSLPTAREACLRAVARDALLQRPQRIVIERDESVQASDERWLREELGPRRARDIEFQHLAKHEEPLLWAADAIAWCIQRGQPWTGLLADLDTATTTVA